MTSDVNTDVDDKEQRKVKAKKHYTNDEESNYNLDYQSCLSPFPKLPALDSSK